MSRGIRGPVPKKRGDMETAPTTINMPCKGAFMAYVQNEGMDLTSFLNEAAFKYLLELKAGKIRHKIKEDKGGYFEES